ncbi:MAG: phosphatidylinositol mannoside acyltransferase [Acidimicrobiales bacterium]
MASYPHPAVAPPASPRPTPPAPGIRAITPLRGVSRGRLKPPAPSWRELRPYHLFRAASAVANALPRSLAVPLIESLAKAVAPLAPRRQAEMIARHQRRAHAEPLDERALARAVRSAYVSYARYWMESLRLASLAPSEIDSRFSIEGLGHIEAAREAGRGAILAIPHLGGWDVGGAWFVSQGFPLTVVAEQVEPPELFEWFADLRRSFGLTVIPLGPKAGFAIVRALRANQVVALLADRDIGGGGIEVDFFGERTTLPAGPATLAQRLKVPLLPTAIYFEGTGHHAVVRPPLSLDGDIGAVTQRMAAELEALIRRVPEQWHLFQPNWPSDRS